MVEDTNNKTTEFVQEYWPCRKTNYTFIWIINTITKRYLVGEAICKSFSRSSGAGKTEIEKNRPKFGPLFLYYNLGQNYAYFLLKLATTSTEGKGGKAGYRFNSV